MRDLGALRGRGRCPGVLLADLDAGDLRAFCLLTLQRGGFHGHAKITWYASHDMDNPSCFWATKWTPVSSKSLVVAPTWKKRWSGKPRGSRAWRLVADRRSAASSSSFAAARSASPSASSTRCLVALQTSLTCQCASCSGQWFDRASARWCLADRAVSTRAFKRLAPISAGVKTKIQWRRVKGPKHWSTRVYGPRVSPAPDARLIAAESVQVIAFRQQRFSYISAFRWQACLLCPHSFRPRWSPPSFLAPLSRTDASFALQSVPQRRRPASTPC